MTDERALVAASRDGDPAALEALVRSHQDRVYSFAMRMCRNVEDAKDILQDTCGGPKELDRKPGVLSEALRGSRYAASRWGSGAK